MDSYHNTRDQFLFFNFKIHITLNLSNFLEEVNLTHLVIYLRTAFFSFVSFIYFLQVPLAQRDPPGQKERKEMLEIREI